MRFAITTTLILLVIMLTSGCGGGGGNGTSLPPGTLAQSSDGKVAILGNASAVPAGVILSVQSKQATQLSPAPSGTAFVAGALVSPANTVFNQPVTIKFILSSPLAAGEDVDLFHLVSGNWLQVAGTIVNVASDRLSVSVQINRVSADGQFALLKI
jgi:hypothetical protein